MWVKARQYTGRIVTLTNDKVFDSPVYNYTRDFPFIWEEMLIPITYQTDLHRVEEILLAAARKLTMPARELGEKSLAVLESRFFITAEDLEPRVFVRLTDNWIELTVRFITTDHGIRDVKDRMSREILQGLNEAGIGIASSTYDIVGMPPLTIKMDSAKA
jgi:small-conductance mechanosensitive channel